MPSDRAATPTGGVVVSVKKFYYKPVANFHKASCGTPVTQGSSVQVERPKPPLHPCEVSQRHGCRHGRRDLRRHRRPLEAANRRLKTRRAARPESELPAVAQLPRPSGRGGVLFRPSGRPIVTGVVRRTTPRHCRALRAEKLSTRLRLRLSRSRGCALSSYAGLHLPCQKGEKNWRTAGGHS